MRIYLAGPMQGIKDFNFPAFHAAARVLRLQGNHTVFSPAEKDEEIYGKDSLKSDKGDIADTKGFSLREALKIDMTWICDHAEAIALLPGWENSKGANAEWALAKALGLQIIYLGPL